jgi:hypothetical protein
MPQRTFAALVEGFGMASELPWLAAALCVALVAGYELRSLRAARRNPAARARSAHRILRGEWVQALSRQPGSEILAVQALRNSLMSSTINASTAVLVLMGSISLTVSSRGVAPPYVTQPISLTTVLELTLVLTLFATYVCSALAMRYYNHAGFAMSLPVGSQERMGREPLAVMYVQRAGVLYSWSLRCFFYAVPIAVGLLSPLSMPIAALALVVVLALFDRVPPTAIAR